MPYSGDPVADAERHYREEEDAAYDACIGTALAAGHSREQAEVCDDGELMCPSCPFRRKRKVYLASSWKMQSAVNSIAAILRHEGHKVFDFTDAENRPDGLGNFVFHASQWLGKPLAKIGWLEFLKCDATKRAFESDKAGLDWADTVVLILPSGRSAHMEAGYGVGQGKDLFIFGDLPPGEFDTMHLFAKGHFDGRDLTPLLHALRV